MMEKLENNSTERCVSLHYECAIIIPALSNSKETVYKNYEMCHTFLHNNQSINPYLPSTNRLYYISRNKSIVNKLSYQAVNKPIEIYKYDIVMKDGGRNFVDRRCGKGDQK